jgi:hypothetical protein
MASYDVASIIRVVPTARHVIDTLVEASFA